MSDELRTAIAGMDGVVESESMFGNDLAYWVHGKEIVHFHGGGVIEIRLTREIIAKRQDQLNSDPRVERRAPSSDWVVASFQLPQDRDFVLELVEAAVDAHRPPYGVTPHPPPEGPGLERRRRFH